MKAGHTLPSLVWRTSLDPKLGMVEVWMAKVTELNALNVVQPGRLSQDPNLVHKFGFCFGHSKEVLVFFSQIKFDESR